MKTYKVGMVGFGFIGKVHAYGHMNIPLFYDQTEFKSKITHVCTSRATTAEKGAAQVGADYAVTDYREITENPDIDIVDICTPNNLHLEAILSAIDGAGTVRVLLTEESGRQTLYQTDVQSDETRRTEDTVLIEDAERRETGLVRQTLEPQYRGAVVLCDGADSNAVKLAIVEAVGCVTGLGADRICVLKRQ